MTITQSLMLSTLYWSTERIRGRANDHTRSLVISGDMGRRGRRVLMLSVKGVVNQNVGGVTFNAKSRKVVQQNSNAEKRVIYNL